MSELNNLVYDLFLKIRELPSHERVTWLEANCSDPKVQQDVLELLQYDIDDRFMEKPVLAPQDHDETYSYRPNAPKPSSIFAGRYKLLQVIGEGGFGIVYMAEQMEPVRRRVAIKLLKANMDSKSAVVRFESERQALAMMDHPNIASVFDGGVADDGTPFFVMELVNGVPITEFCDANQLKHSDRMKLLMTVCDAVQHAHQKGIIHRDLKPSNILVSLRDGVAVPKVIDFGIAKALHGPLTDKTLFTSFQQMIGTPEYMSPEQAETSLLDIDTRSDVFSLGVLAYELLTGTTPFDGRSLRKLAFAEIQRTIREVDPPKPSDRISTLGEQGNRIAGNHGVSQSGMQKSLRGDLDWIVMKAMEKDRNRRYGSAQSMAEDLRRWMQEEPIEARPPSFVYRAYKMLRRYRTRFAVAAILTAGAFLTAMGLGYGISERRASQLASLKSMQRSEELQSIADAEASRNRSLRYGNSMVAAYESFRSGRRLTTLELLAECPEDKRGIEWKWLSHIASDQTGLLVQGSENAAQNAIVYRHSDERIYSVGSDGMLRLWNADTQQELQSWRASNESITAMDISKDDSVIVMASASGHIVVWDESKGQMIESVSESCKPVTVAVTTINSAKPGRIAVGCEDGSILVWSESLQSEPQRFVNKELPFRGPIQTLQFTKGGNQLLAAGKGGVTLFDSSTGDVIKAAGQGWQSYSAAIADELDRFILFGPPVVTIDQSLSGEQNLLEVTSTGIVSGQYVPGDKCLVIATEDQCLRRIHLESGYQETLGYYHGGAIEKIRAAHDGSSIAIIDTSGSIRLLRQRAFSSLESFRAFDCEVSSVAANRSNEVYCLSDQGELVAWDANTNQERMRTAAHQYQGFSLALDKKGASLISNGLDQQLSIWSAVTHERLNQMPLSLGARYIAMHPDGKHLAGPMPRDLKAVAASNLDMSAAMDSNLAYWNLETGQVERCFAKLSNWAMKLAFSEDGAMLAAATISDGAVVWRMDSEQPIRLFIEGHPQVDEVVFSKDGKYLFVGYHNGRVYVWDIEQKEVVRKLVCHGDQITGLLVTGDGSRIVTCSASDSRLRVWDWQTGQKCAEFDLGLAGVSTMSFVDNYQCLLIGGKDGYVHRWRLQ